MARSGCSSGGPNCNHVFGFVRLEDMAYDKRPGMSNIVYVVDSGRGTVPPAGTPQSGSGISTNGRVWKMVLDKHDPTTVTSLSVLIEGDDNPVKTAGEAISRTTSNRRRKASTSPRTQAPASNSTTARPSSPMVGGPRPDLAVQALHRDHVRDRQGRPVRGRRPDRRRRSGAAAAGWRLGTRQSRRLGGERDHRRLGLLRSGGRSSSRSRHTRSSWRQGRASTSPATASRTSSTSARGAAPAPPRSGRLIVRS